MLSQRKGCRARADAVGLAQGPVDRRVSATHISAPCTRGETLDGSASPALVDFAVIVG